MINNEQNMEQLMQDINYLKENVDTMNQIWVIEDAYIKSNIPIIGRLIVLLKRAIRKTIYWFIRPYWDQQIAFNSAAASAVSDLYRIQSRLLEGAQFEVREQNPQVILEETDEPRVIQLVSSLNFGDAVGNDVIAFKNALKEQGIVTEIFANNIHKRIAPGTARFFKELPALKENDIVIYHFASECPMAEAVKKLPCKKILRYHNITPPAFFHGYDADAEKATKNGLKQVKELAPYIDFGLPVSEFNKHDLEEMGYKCPMEVLSILIQFEDYAQKPSEKIIKKYKDGITNILFVGRMAPNKKVEDVISAFHYYKTHYDETARLFLVGSFSEENKYYQMLVKHIAKLGVKDVIFPGHISFDEILGYYSVADVFLCMSEHEGFCVPLVEAMYFKVPIVAYSSTAIPDTLSGSGVVVDEKDYAVIGSTINKLINDSEFRNKIINEQNNRLKAFDNVSLKQKFIEYLEQQVGK